jgi:hypothetical protein
MRRAALLSFGLFTGGSLFSQMLLPSGTALTVDEGTSFRIDAPLTWTFEPGSSGVNNGTIVLGPVTDLDEALGAAVTGTGTERTTRDLSGPLADENPGGFGGILTTSGSLGTTSIVRGHLPFTDYSGHTSLARWIDFTPANNSGLNAALGFRYDPAELNGLVETEQRVHIRAQQDIWWTLGSAVNTGTHTLTTTGLDSLGLFTTFDTDLPNAITGIPAEGGFALLGAPGEQLYLRVPIGARAETLEIFAANGSRLASLSPHWGEGLHALPELSAASGVYQLRVNSQRTFSFLCP